MHTDDLRRRLLAHLDTLAVQIGPRPSGSPANRRATDYLQSVLTSAGLHVEALPFTTSWWEPGDGRLEPAGAAPIDVTPNPFSSAGRVLGEVARLESRDDLARDNPYLRGRIIVLGADLSSPVMPKGFPFYMPDEHRRLIDFLERCEPSAVIATSDRHASLPTFEDPDLGFPSITVSPATAAKLRTGDKIGLTLGGKTRSGEGVNVAARTDGTERRAVVSAHIDAKATTPGAFDNAASVAALLALAETSVDLLAHTELVFFNGEDHYDACGEQAWLAATDLSKVGLNINLDGTGVAGRRTGVAAIGCPPALEQLLDRQLAGLQEWTRMPPWFESDHAIFAAQGIAAVAITSEGVHDLFSSVAHTAADTVDLVDVKILGEVVDFLRTLLPQVRRALVGAASP